MCCKYPPNFPIVPRLGVYLVQICRHFHERSITVLLRALHNLAHGDTWTAVIPPLPTYCRGRRAAACTRCVVIRGLSLAEPDARCGLEDSTQSIGHPKTPSIAGHVVKRHDAATNSVNSDSKQHPGRGNPSFLGIGTLQPTHETIDRCAAHRQPADRS